MKKTKQETFDYIVSNLIQQGAPSSTRCSLGMINCLYRHPAGLRCAAGWCITDERYDKSMEGRSVDDVFVLSAVKDAGWDFDVVCSMQALHDNNAGDEPWLPLFLAAARSYAIDNQLNCDVIK